MQFNNTILIIPGLGNSGEGHWQSIWEQRFHFERVHQADWETPVCSDWIHSIAETITKFNTANIILVGHSLACNTIANWALKYNQPVKAALLVAPSDTEAKTYPAGTTGFTLMLTNKLPFKSIVVTSTNDYYVTPERATYFAGNWGSELINIGDAGHINISSGYGEWPQGLELLERLDQEYK